MPTASVKKKTARNQILASPLFKKCQAHKDKKKTKRKPKNRKDAFFCDDDFYFNN